MPAAADLLDRLADRDPAVRGAAAEALGRLGDKSAVDPLLAALQRESDWPLKAHGLDALWRLVRGACVARLDGDVLRISARYTAVVQGEGTVEIPFRVEGAALERIANLRGDALTFDRPGTYEVEATISVKLARDGDFLRGSFRLPMAAGHTVALDLPPEVEGEVGPIVRAFRSGADGGKVVGYPDETGLFQLWMKPLAPARRLDALLGAAFDTIAVPGPSA